MSNNIKVTEYKSRFFNKIYNFIKTICNFITTNKSKLEKNEKLKRQTHLYCKKCSSCQSEYGKLNCEECGNSMSEENKVYY